MKNKNLIIKALFGAMFIGNMFGGNDNPLDENNHEQNDRFDETPWDNYQMNPAIIEKYTESLNKLNFLFAIENQKYYHYTSEKLEKLFYVLNFFENKILPSLIIDSVNSESILNRYHNSVQKYIQQTLTIQRNQHRLYHPIPLYFLASIVFKFRKMIEEHEYSDVSNSDGYANFSINYNDNDILEFKKKLYNLHLFEENFIGTIDYYIIQRSEFGELSFTEYFETVLDNINDIARRYVF